MKTHAPHTPAPVNARAALIYDKQNAHDKNGCQNGTIKMADGRLIDLVQQAYIQQGGTPTATWYEAAGEDRDTGDDYKIRWEITNGKTEDESESCDWDNFEVVKL